MVGERGVSTGSSEWPGRKGVVVGLTLITFDFDSPFVESKIAFKPVNFHSSVTYPTKPTTIPKGVSSSRSGRWCPASPPTFF